MLQLLSVGAVLGQTQVPAVPAVPETCMTCFDSLGTVSIVELNLCEHAQMAMKLQLASLLQNPKFVNLTQITCDFTAPEPAYGMPPNADPGMIASFKAHKTGVHLILHYVLWSVVCHAMDELACRIASNTPCRWHPNGGPHGDGFCTISDRTCVENTHKDSCTENSACRWVPHDDVADVSYVPCRPIRTWDELCAVYTYESGCSTNEHCRWNTANGGSCIFNSCESSPSTEGYAAYNSDCECSCSKNGADPIIPTDICHYGQKCVISTASDGPYAIIEGKCVASPPTGYANTCGSYWDSNYCAEGSPDESKNWRPLWSQCATPLPSSEPWKTCCRRTCGAWVSYGNSCGPTELLQSTKLCGIDKDCNQATCCKPTCAGFNCNDPATMPAGLQDGSVLKPGSLNIPCKEDENGKFVCDFDMCCEITCKAKRDNICDEIKDEFPRPNAGELLCHLNPNAQGSDVADDGCNNKYCCNVLYKTCGDVVANYQGQCGYANSSDWHYSTSLASKPCGGQNDYKCGYPTYCCQRKCSDFLGYSSCPAGQNSQVKKDEICDHDCSIEKCCTKTCANFDCQSETTGMFLVDNAASLVCANAGDCSHKKCCKPTCKTHKLYPPVAELSPYQQCTGDGVEWRDYPEQRYCGAPGTSYDCLSDSYCCQKTCKQYTSTTGCPAGYLPKNNAATVCGEPGGQPCGSDLCCVPTCNSFVNSPGPGCGAGWAPTSPTSKQCTLEPHNNKYSCYFHECCERTCSAYIASTTTTTTGTDSNGYPVPVTTTNVCAEAGLVANPSQSSTICNSYCSAQKCCEHTCKSSNTCYGLGVAYLDGMEDVRCSSFASGDCTVAYCCGVTCAAFAETSCAAGYVKDSDKNSKSCVATGTKTGTASDCNSAQCCKPTCASYTCTAGYVPKNVYANSLVCVGGVCNNEQCCDTTCDSWYGYPYQCPQYAQKIDYTATKCQYGEDCETKCCKPTCASWLQKEGLGNDATCGINSVSAFDGNTYVGGLKRNNVNTLVCADNKEGGGYCDKAYCCEYTCAKFYAVSCLNTGTLGINKVNAQSACSANPSPPSQSQEGLERFFPCHRDFCCVDPCVPVQQCPQNEVKRTTAECSSLTTCNLKECCVCADNKSCITDISEIPMQSCQLGDQYTGGAKSCKALAACQQPSSEIVSTTCTCGVAKGDGSHVCRSYKNEHCYPIGEPRCVPTCSEGANANACQCGATVCSTQNFCQSSSGTCTNCGTLTPATCDLNYCKLIVGYGGQEECTANTSGAALLVANSGLSTGAIVGCVVGAVLLFAAGVFTASALPKKKKRAHPPSVDEYAQ